jgi:uncharacterized membrane protein HdeD (DUF308 family)
LINQSEWFLREEQNMTGTMDEGLKKLGVTVSKPALAIIAIFFGILVIVFQSLLVWIVGLYFIIQGILLLLDYMELRNAIDRPIKLRKKAEHEPSTRKSEK